MPYTHEIKALRDERQVLLDALRDAQELIDVALPQFDWGASALSAEAIQLLNEVPRKVKQAIERAEEPRWRT
jgi:hypothetical protein